MLLVLLWATPHTGMAWRWIAFNTAATLRARALSALLIGGGVRAQPHLPALAPM